MHRIIQSYLNQFVTENELTAIGEAYQFEHFVNYCVISQFFPERFELDSAHTSTDDLGIDGVGVLLGDELVTTSEEARGLLKSSKARRTLSAQYVFCQAKRSDSFDLGEMLKLGNGVASLFGDGPKPRDETISEFLEIHELVVDNLSQIQNGRPVCSLYFASTGTWIETNGLRQRAIDPSISNLVRLGLFHRVTFEPIDREHLVKLWVRTRSPVQATFPVKGTVSLPPINNVTEAYLALAPAKAFIENVLSDEERRLRLSIFEQNVRSFLGDDNPVNQRITEALLNPAHHDRFAINNNGITIVSPDVKVQSDRVSVSSYQIVNGCQTSHVLYRNYDNVSDSVWISVKIIEAEDPNIVAQLVESTNSQTMVQKSQFLSILPITSKIETYFNTFDGQGEENERRLYFERRTNQYAGAGISNYRIYDIPKLARAFAAMFLDLPHISYMFPTKVLEERPGDLFPSNIQEHVYYTSALTLYRLELAISNRHIHHKYGPYKWHILMILKYLLGGAKAPRFESGKIEDFCSRIDRAFAKGGSASAPPFQTATTIIDKIGDVTRNRRKTQKYTDEVKNEAIQSASKNSRSS